MMGYIEKAVVGRRHEATTVQKKPALRRAMARSCDVYLGKCLSRISRNT